MEARVYAEDPPAASCPGGTRGLVHWPRAGRGSTPRSSPPGVGTHYDPLLGKATVLATCREPARHALVRALDDTAILGSPPSRLPAGAGRLGRLPRRRHRHLLARLSPRTAEPPRSRCRLVPRRRALATAGLGGGPGPLSTPDGWRLGGAGPIPLTLALREATATHPGGPATRSTHLVGVLWTDGRDRSRRRWGVPGRSCCSRSTARSRPVTCSSIPTRCSGLLRSDLHVRASRSLRLEP